jgi:hypothetical protein
MASETGLSSLSPAIGADWGISAPAFSPVLHPKWLGIFFDTTFLFLLAANSANLDLAFSVFYTQRLVNGFQARAHMD